MPKTVVDFTGTVSRATMRPEDLVPAFMEVLEEYWPEKAVELTGFYGGEYGWPYSMSGLHYPDPIPEDLQEAAGYLVEDLFDAMQEIAPEGYYFGSTPGDGCDYEFWPLDDDD